MSNETLAYLLKVLAFLELGQTDTAKAYIKQSLQDAPINQGNDNGKSDVEKH